MLAGLSVGWLAGLLVGEWVGWLVGLDRSESVQIRTHVVLIIDVKHEEVVPEGGEGGGGAVMSIV